MQTTLEWNDNPYVVDLSGGVDLSIPLDHRQIGVNCFYAPPFHAEPVITDDFIGSVSQGGGLNFYNVKLNPHGNGTHTESVGHISKDQFSVNKALRSFHFFAELISVIPTKLENGDRVITRQTLDSAVKRSGVEALVIRTLPNSTEKLSRQYSGTNPPYLAEDAMAWICERRYKHLLIDLPSVDREEDDGKLTNHKRFWNVSVVRQTHKTITELIFVPNKTNDGLYLLNLQVASIELDASPSRPVLYPMIEKQ